MVVFTRTAAVSTSNSAYDEPLATEESLGQYAVDHGLCQLCEGYQMTADWIQVQKGVQSVFIPSASKNHRKYSFSYLHLVTFLTFMIHLIAIKYLF